LRRRAYALRVPVERDHKFRWNMRFENLIQEHDSIDGYYRTPRGWMDHELFWREPFRRLQAWIWLNEN
jgi:hypothetical protein